MVSVGQQAVAMPTWTKLGLAIVVGLAAVLWLAQFVQGRIAAAVVEGLATRARQEPVRSPRSLEDLPAPVRRYLEHALPADRRGLRLARYEQTGVLRSDPLRDDWMPFTASQMIGPATREFVWIARARVAPLLHVQVRDSLTGGRGAGQVTLLSAIPVASAGASPEMNSGALHRFLAEAVWCPSALLPSQHLQWTTVDESRAIATLTSGSTAVSLEFRFNADNEVAGIYTPGRWGSFGGAYKQVEWEGMFRNYARRQGVLVPGDGEVGWTIDGQWRSVWRGTVVAATLEFQ